MAFNLTTEYSFVAESASGIARGLRVKLNSNGKIEPAGISDVELGVTHTMSSNGEDPVAVILSTAPGSAEYTAVGPVAKYAQVRRAADGKVDDDGAGGVIGIALSGAAEDGDWIEVLKVAGL